MYSDNAVHPVQFPTPTFQARLDANAAAEVVDLKPSDQYEPPSMNLGPPPYPVCINYPICLQPADHQGVCSDNTVKPPSETARLNDHP